MLCIILVQKGKRFFLSTKINVNSLKNELTKLFEERELLKRNCLKPNVIRGSFLENKKIICCLDKQELRVQCADRALHESSMQLQSQRMELHQANQLSDHSQREKSWLCTELDRKERLLQEDRMRSLQEKQELKKMCCIEAEKAKQLRRDELSIQEKESKSTVNHLMVQIQELRDKVNSLSEAREFYDPETASRFRLSSWIDQPRFLPAVRYTELTWYIKKRF